jgi:hypothetical protein
MAFEVACAFSEAAYVDFGLLVSGFYASEERNTGAVVAGGATLLWMVLVVVERWLPGGWLVEPRGRDKWVCACCWCCVDLMVWKMRWLGLLVLVLGCGDCRGLLWTALLSRGKGESL